jgi:transcriptional regulator with XRE-family HTH domain
MTDDANLPPLARNVKELRRFRRLSQADLAESCRLSAKTIYLIEHGKHSPNVATLEALGKALGVDPRSLLVDPDAVSTTSRWLVELRKLLAGVSAPLRRSIAGLVRDLTASPDTTTRLRR